MSRDTATEMEGERTSINSISVFVQIDVAVTF